jgi:uroporphyrin-III C-methyltransferase
MMLPKAKQQLLCLWGLINWPEITEIFKSEGKNKLPVAVIQSGTTANEKVTVATVDTIVDAVKENNIGSPAIIVLGEVVSLHPKYQLIKEIYDVVAKG